MPANLSPEYIRLDAKLRDARDPQEKLVILREMLRVIPKHKGTDKLQGDLKRRISKLEENAQQSAKRGARDLFHVAREGVGQVLLAGAPNVGKSLILERVTNATPQIGAYPFTTQQPLPGMVVFEDVQIQLVDLPPVSRDYAEAALFNACRISDLLLLVTDLSRSDPVADLHETMAVLEEHLVRPVGVPVDTSPGNASQVEKQALVLGNKCDLDPGRRGDALRAAFGKTYKVHLCSAETGTGLDDLGRLLFVTLQLVRIYTKKPGKRFERDAPFVLPAGSTVIDVARAIHKDIAERLRFVRLWGSGKHDGTSAPRDHVVADGDILEIHAG